MKLLLRNGANPNLQDNRGRTPLHYMVIEGNEEGVKLLLEHGADKEIEDSMGNKPVDLARQYRSKPIYKLLK